MRFPNPNLVPHDRFAPSLRVADSYVGATSGPRLGPGGIFVGLLSSGTPGRPIHRSHGVTPSSQDLFTRHRRCCQVFDSFAFDEVLPVSSERMLRWQKLSMQVEAGILATRLQPMKLKSSLACWACEPSMNTHAREKRIRRKVMHRVLLPHMHYEGLFASCIVCLQPFIPSLLQFLLQRFHVHIHIIPWIFGPWYYQCQENVLPFHNLRGGRLSGMKNTGQQLYEAANRPKG